MQNVVSLLPERPRPPRPLAAARGGAQILFFTGVRYCRDDEADPRAERGEEPVRLEAKRGFNQAQ